MEVSALTQKYHVAAPRYTSYPTVPYWDASSMDVNKWTETVAFSYPEGGQTEGISLYIHLPFCESLCTYCGCNKRITRNHQVELPYIHAVLKEWKGYRRLFRNQPLIREIHLGGGTPTFFSPGNLAFLIRGLLKNARIHEKAEFGFEAHPASTTPEHLETLYRLGFRRLSLGIQDFDPEVQRIINRVQSYEEVKEITWKARAIGYHSINFDLIYGLPLQTLSNFEKTIRKTVSLAPDRIAFYSYAHVPWKQPGQRRYTEAHLPSLEVKQQLHEFGRGLFGMYGYEEIGMDHFALRSDSLYRAAASGNLHRNFMGYTHQYTRMLIGLGVSAISDAWHAYAQNVKKVEDYLAAVDQGRFPFLKGHFLSADDQVIRRHILNLMCKGKTGWEPTSPDSEALVEGLQRMQALAKDGLVLTGENSLEVTPTGKRFLRNICMALDARLWANQPDAQLFSMSV